MCTAVGLGDFLVLGLRFEGLRALTVAGFRLPAVGVQNLGSVLDLQLALQHGTRYLKYISKNVGNYLGI